MKLDTNALLPQLHFGLKQLQLELNPVSEQRLLDYAALIFKWRAQINITGYKLAEDILHFLILDSLAVAPYLHGDNLLDIGTGAGVPGIPLAIINPQQQWLLCDSNQKKMSFVTMARHQLPCDNIDLFIGRIQDLQNQQPFSTITCRAFSSVQNVLEITQHVQTRDDCRWLFLKGDHYADELQDLVSGFVVEQILTLNVPGINKQRYAVIIKRG